MFIFFFDTKPDDWEPKVLPDFEALKELINKAKGPTRTQDEFARECGTNASKLSRITNGKAKKPISVELLQQIAEHADRNSKVTLSSLLYANGMRPKEGSLAETQLHMEKEKDTEKTAHTEQDDVVAQPAINKDDEFLNQHRKRMQEMREKENQIRDGLTSELLNRKGGSIAISSNVRNQFFWDVDFTTGQFEGCDEWLVNIQVTLPKREGEGQRLPVNYRVHRAMDGLNRIFLTDQWEPEKFQGKKCTFVYTDKEVYAGLKNDLQVAKTNNCFTIMLVDYDNLNIIDEWLVPSRNEWKNVLLKDIPIFTAEDDFKDIAEEYEFRKHHPEDQE